MIIIKEQLKIVHAKHHSGQDFEEIYWLYQKALALDPHVIMEIGVYTGGTLLLLSCMCNRPDDLVISLDCGWDKWKEFGWDITTVTPKVKLIDGDSHQPETLGMVKKVLGNKPIDFLFIDGDHSEKGVALDYKMYAPLVRDGGIIGFHDLNMGAEPGKPEEGKVKGFWNKLDHKKYSFYMHPEDEGVFGIGYIIKGEKKDAHETPTEV